MIGVKPCGHVQSVGEHSPINIKTIIVANHHKPLMEYIESQDAMVQPLLLQLDQIIRSAIPHATRKIAWSMPTYYQKTNLIQFAAFKKHIGLYPGAEAVEAFKDQLSSYKTHKGTIQLPYDQPLPIELIQTIAKWCLHHYGH